MISSKPGSAPVFGQAPSALARLLALAADVHLNGTRPWDIQVHSPRLYQRLARRWSLGAGEAYMDGDWDCERLDELFARLMAADLDKHSPAWAAQAQDTLRGWIQSLWNLQSPQRAWQVAHHHYDAGADVFEAMLDERMVYSCGYWAHASDLAQAQTDKLAMICQKLQLQPGEHLLDIGCGWGGLASYAAQHHGVKVTGVTISQAQLALARQRCSGLPVTLLLQDWRQLNGRFDKIASVGMFEHVGPKNHAAFFDTTARLLAPQGLFLLHTIGLDQPARSTDAWIDRYVFPNGRLPCASALASAVQQRFILEDWHAFGADYDRTLMAWWQRFEAAWPQLALHYDERFHRMWRYYLLCCAGFFRSRQGQLWQLVLSHRGRQAVYRSIRP